MVFYFKKMKISIIIPNVHVMVWKSGAKVSKKATNFSVYRKADFIQPTTYYLPFAANRSINL